MPFHCNSFVTFTTLKSSMSIPYDGTFVCPTNLADTEIEGDYIVDQICEELRLEPQLQHNWWAILDSVQTAKGFLS